MDWIAPVALGVFHGVNPAMGWLFAVALGLQVGSGELRARGRGRVVRSLGPLALGHQLSVAVLAVLIATVEVVIARRVLLIAGGLVLVVFGAWRLVRQRHPRWVGMRVSAADLVLWSFLMSSVHGAGLMLLPVLTLGAGHAAGGHEGHAVVASAGHGLLVAAVHGAALIVTMGVVALVVYEVVGTDILRRAWFNLDRLWALALVGAGVVVLLG